MDIPATVTSIGKGAFVACGVKHWDLSKKGLAEIPQDCFVMCGAEKIVIPGTAKSIGANAFGNCQKLEEIVLEDGVETIGEKAFANCPKLKLVQIPNSVTHLDVSMLAGSENAYFELQPDNPIWENNTDKELASRCVLPLICPLAGTYIESLPANERAELIMRSQSVAMRRAATNESM